MAFRKGVQLTSSFDRGPWSVYGNIAWSRAVGYRNYLGTVQFRSPDELAFIGNNYIHLDHDQTWSGSAGAAYTLNMDTQHPTRVLGGRTAAKRTPSKHGHDSERGRAADLRHGEFVRPSRR